MLVARRKLDRVVALELPDLGQADSGFAGRLVEAVRAVRTARQDIRHVFLVGGGASGELVTTITRELSIPCTRSSDPLAPARAGARLDGLACVDVGRTSIKIVDGSRASGIDRDVAKAPLRDGVSPTDLAAARESTIAFLAALLADLSPKILLALPCKIVDRVAAGSSYCWRDPDPELLPELAKRADRQLEVVEDIELAALSAAENRLVPKTAATLVLAIGHGARGALLVPE